MPGTRLVKLGHDGGVVARISEAICGIEEAPDVASLIRATSSPTSERTRARSATHNHEC
jgi:hypothetical protein